MACTTCGCGTCGTAQPCTNVLDATHLTRDEEQQKSGLADLSDCTYFQDALAALAGDQVDVDSPTDEEGPGAEPGTAPSDGNGSGGDEPKEPAEEDGAGGSDPAGGNWSDPADFAPAGGQLIDGQAILSGLAVGAVGLFGLGLIKRALQG